MADIKDLEDVLVNFDGITYAKGASVLKQLVAYVGREHFREGVRAYFRAHAWGNTTLEDLLTELEAASGRDLREWSKVWLETASVNILRPVIEVDEAGIMTRVTIEQSHLDGFPTLRPHRLAIGLYAVRDGVFVRTDRVELDVAGAATEVTRLIGQARPDLLLVNDDDLTYAKIRLDQADVAAVLAHPRGFTDSMPRTLTLASLWDMTRDGELAARDFVGVVLPTLPGESDSTLLRTLLLQLQTAVYFYVAPEHREAVRTDVRDRLWELARSAEPGSDAQLQLVNAAAAFVAGGDDPAYLLQLLDGSASIPGLEVDFEVRWTLVTAAAAAGDLTNADIDAERAREDTATARERAAKARAAIPTAQAKAEIWRSVTQDDLPNAIIDSAGLGFTRLGTPADVLEPYVAIYHDTLEQLISLGSPTIMESIARGFYPRGLADVRLRDATRAWLDGHPEAPDALRRIITENADPITRALAAQERDRR